MLAAPQQTISLTLPLGAALLIVPAAMLVIGIQDLDNAWLAALCHRVATIFIFEVATGAIPLKIRGMAQINTLEVIFIGTVPEGIGAAAAKGLVGLGGGGGQGLPAIEEFVKVVAALLELRRRILWLLARIERGCVLLVRGVVLATGAGSLAREGGEVDLFGE